MSDSLKLHYLRDKGIFILLLVEGNLSEGDNYKTMIHLILPSPITYSMPWKMQRQIRNAPSENLLSSLIFNPESHSM